MLGIVARRRRHWNLPIPRGGTKHEVADGSSPERSRHGTENAMADNIGHDWRNPGATMLMTVQRSIR